MDELPRTSRGRNGFTNPNMHYAKHHKDRRLLGDNADIHRVGGDGKEKEEYGVYVTQGGCLRGGNL